MRDVSRARECYGYAVTTDFREDCALGWSGTMLQTMTATNLFDAEFAEHANVVEATQRTLREPLAAMLEAWLSTIRRGGKIMFFGNGGSASDAQHLATELTIRYSVNRAPVAAVALNTDTSVLTAAGNDLGFEHIFARQIEALGRPEDLALAISTSGRSPNIIAAVTMAKAMGMTAAAFTGRDGGELNGLADPLLIVPSNATARIQEMHIALGHMLCGALEIELGLVS